MADMICPKCGRNYSDDLLYCLDDGTALLEVREEPEVETVAHPRIVVDALASNSQEFCPHCGSPNKSGSRFCKKCGQPLADGSETQQVTPPIYEPTPSDPILEVPRRKSYAGWIALGFGLAGLFLLVIIFGVIAYLTTNSNVASNSMPVKSVTPSPSPKVMASPTPTTDQNNINAQTTSRIGKTGTLTTDANLREEPDPNSDKVGTHYKGAHIKVLEVAEVPNDEGGTSIWYHIVVTSYGRSSDPTNAGQDKDPGSADEGWINSNPKVYDQSKKTQVHKKTVDFDDNK
ncbi:MAG: zinc ribbon domain-containing protein [Acidobacteria bacterium]|nr:zinc ribbon domain-containing protein [Acidobacteriota bacterium]